MMDQIVLYVVATDISKRLEEGSEFDDFMLIDTGTTLATGPGASTDANTDGSGSLECCCFVS